MASDSWSLSSLPKFWDHSCTSPPPKPFKESSFRLCFTLQMRLLGCGQTETSLWGSLMARQWEAEPGRSAEARTICGVCKIPASSPWRITGSLWSSEFTGICTFSRVSCLFVCLFYVIKNIMSICSQLQDQETEGSIPNSEECRIGLERVPGWVACAPIHALVGLRQGDPFCPPLFCCDFCLQS